MPGTRDAESPKNHCSASEKEGEPLSACVILASNHIKSAAEEASRTASVVEAQSPLPIGTTGEKVRRYLVAISS